MVGEIIYFFIGIGLFFNFMGSVGLLRFPDVYTRLHAATKCTTFGSIFVIVAVALYGATCWSDGVLGDLTLSLHSLVALAALLITNPTGAHAIARAAYRSGIKPVGAVVDDLEEARK